MGTDISMKDDGNVGGKKFGYDKKGMAAASKEAKILGRRNPRSRRANF